MSNVHQQGSGMATVEGSGVDNLMPMPIALWDGVIQPILAVLREHTTVEGIKQLCDMADRADDIPIAVVDVLDALYILRQEIDRL